MGIPKETRFLVIDDMPTLRDLVKHQLKALGYQNIIEAADGEQGIRILQQADSSGVKIDFVVSDWNMPKVSGLDLLKMVRAQQQWIALPFVLLTSESERDHVTEAILAGVSQYIVKPFTAKSFEEKLNSAWNKHQAGS
jgi:two-component system, chemotaxis family, chemotaxis protein CheY